MRPPQFDPNCRFCDETSCIGCYYFDRQDGEMEDDMEEQAEILTEEAMEITVKPEGLIQVVQLPEIREKLLTIKEQWESVVAECESLACTGESLQAVKARRSDINHAFDELEAQRKAAKRAVMKPYEDFEAVYKECVTDPHNRAESALKGKIADVENGIKAACEAKLRLYFVEIREREHVGDWLTWEMAGIKIGLTDARKKVPSALMGQIADLIGRVSAEMSSIDGMENAPEIREEYKRNGLNLAAAISAVSDRHARIEAERQEAAQRAEAERLAREAVERVSQAAALAPPTVEPAAPEKPKEPAFPADVSFTLHIETADQLAAVRPLLKALKALCEKEGISYE